jgi:hypothetical protein
VDVYRPPFEHGPPHHRAPLDRKVLAGRVRGSEGPGTRCNGQRVALNPVDEHVGGLAQLRRALGHSTEDSLKVSWRRRDDAQDLRGCGLLFERRAQLPIA